MTPEQFPGSFDYLNNLNIQQLQGILRSELESEEVNVELIKKINAVLGSKTEKKEIDVDSAYERFLQASNTEPIYSEILDETEEIGFPDIHHHPKIRYLAKFGVVAAIIVALLMGTSIVAYAMGFNVWDAVAVWTENRFNFLSNGNDILSNESQIDDPYAELREVLVSRGVTANVVPSYIPYGYVMMDINSFESVDGPAVVCTLKSSEQAVMISYIALQEEPSISHVKDEGTPEVYISSGIEHYIYSNENYYRATWLYGNVECDFSGFIEKSELLKIIDSIYGR